MAEEPTMKYCPHIECGGKLQPHTYDDGIGALDCDGPCSPRRVQMWRDNMQATKEAKPVPVCITIPHVAYAAPVRIWDCEAHGNDMPCPCGCGTTMCNHVAADDPRVCPETGIVDCGTEHCSIHG